MVIEPHLIDIVCQEIEQGRGGEHLLSDADKILGAIKHVDEYFFVGYTGAMQIHLPIHQATSCEVVFKRINTFMFYYKRIVYHIEHLNDTG